MLDRVKIIPLGGLDEHFKNLTIIEINDDIFVIQAGIKDADKTKPGVDFVIANFDYLKANKHKIRGYFLTHGFDSYSAGIAYIYPECPAPIYLTAMSKLFFSSFCVHNKIDISKFEFKVVEPTSTQIVANRKIELFSVCANISDSFGVSISTDGGNIVFITNFVIDTCYEKGFVTDLTKMGLIAKEGVFALLCESVYSERPGFANPFYKLANRIDRLIKDAPGRVFLAIDQPNVYNFIAAIKIAKKYNRKIIPYDISTREILMALGASGQLILDRNDILPMDEINRERAKDIMVVMSGFGEKLFDKVSLLALHQNDNQLLKLNENDLFILGAHTDFSSERAAIEALDNLYRSGAKVYSPNKKDYIRMHACEEDIKSILTYFRPKYFIPVLGTFKELLANAKLALTANVGLTHMSVFILDNGNVLEFNNGRAILHPEKVANGDLYIDGKGVGDVASSVLLERQKFSDGVIILAATVSKSERAIVGGPDVQTRGLVYVRESESLINEITNIFVINLKQCLAKPIFSSSEVENNVKEQVFRAVRRTTLKSPMIIPIIVEID